MALPGLSQPPPSMKPTSSGHPKLLMEGGCCPGPGGMLWVQGKSSLGSHGIYYGMLGEEPKVGQGC